MTVAEESQAGEARRAAVALAREGGFDETAQSCLAIVVTELATNIVKHAGEGILFLRSTKRRNTDVVEVLAIDRGPGMDVKRALRDGYSTAGTAGTGLGAVERLSAWFDVTSAPAAGTVVLATVAGGGRPSVRQPTLDVGVIRVPMKGEDVCGDGWAWRDGDGVTTLLVVDGLGHGPAAFDAAKAAVTAFETGRGHAPGPVLERVHAALRPTRGAAVAAASVDTRRRIVTFAGIGNIMGTVVGDGNDRQMVSHAGIAGHDARRIAEFTYPWPPGGVIVLASDGLITHWDLRKYPGLLARDPSVIAGVLYRDFNRGRDDLMIVVARQPQP
ncbi:MAG: SpoIIE family protein phosphatase [Candidatus Rokubacteria bacterium]|nr:SpoIIE family protein phosphatase [Candidatus Rokubacteria bacterium]